MMKGTLSKYETKQEVLDVFPNAVFMPWDKPEEGMRVKRTRVSGEVQTGTVIGREEVTAVPEQDHNCPKCRCTKVNAFYHWWIIHWDGWYMHPNGLGSMLYKPDELPEDAKPERCLEFPPVLEKI